MDWSLAGDKQLIGAPLTHRFTLAAENKVIELGSWGDTLPDAAEWPQDTEPDFQQVFTERPLDFQAQFNTACPRRYHSRGLRSNTLIGDLFLVELADDRYLAIQE